MAQNQKTTTSTEHVPANEHGGGFPPFQKETFASQIVWLVITFVALYVVISRIAVPRIGGIIERRGQRIESDFAEAQGDKEEYEGGLLAEVKDMSTAGGSDPW